MAMLQSSSPRSPAVGYSSPRLSGQGTPHSRPRSSRGSDWYADMQREKVEEMAELCAQQIEDLDVQNAALTDKVQTAHSRVAELEGEKTRLEAELAAQKTKHAAELQALKEQLEGELKAQSLRLQSELEVQTLRLGAAEAKSGEDLAA